MSVAYVPRPKPHRPMGKPLKLDHAFVTARLDVAQRNQLVEVAKSRGVSLTHVIRGALAAFLAGDPQ